MGEIIQTDSAFLSRSDAGSASEDDDDMTEDLTYDHDYLSDPLNATVIESEDAVIEPLINSTIVLKKDDGSQANCIVIDKRPGENENDFLYVLKEIDSNIQVTVDLATIVWSPLGKESAG